VPCLRVVACNPPETKGPDVPPAFSGYPAADRDGWPAFRAEYDKVHRSLWGEFSDWYASQGAPPLPDLEFIGEGAVNLYVYPQVADYARTTAPGQAWHRIDSSVRQTDAAFALPERLAGDDGALIYFSLGSLGSADVPLMRRIIGCLASTRDRDIVPKGRVDADLE